ncbi:MAG: Flp pilus assembly complex ATPase component TadA [Candidatus Omnitrophica bacterium]|nr:Flp pilus assembly complex ATPase component TadA [Candidatus Omnitrophota bacterium]
MAKSAKITDILLAKKLITMEQLDTVIEEQKLSGVQIQKILVNKGMISSEGLAKVLADQLEIPYVELTSEAVDPQAAQMIPAETARKFKAIPTKIEGETIFVAFASPLNLPARDEIGRITGLKISPMVATEKEIDRALNQYYKVEDTSRQALIDMRMEKLKKLEQKKVVKKKEEYEAVEELPVVKLVNDVIGGAINAKASDVHLEPGDGDMVVRYRVDGILHDIMTVPAHIVPSVISRIKILSNLDITKYRVPQDGHITIEKDGKNYDLRVSTLLTIAGEKIVLRVLDRESMMISLGELGFTRQDEDEFKKLISKPYGMILVTGPTGSGKTTTLYAGLNQMNSKTDNIVTIENPVEYRLDRINQIQVDSAAKLTFATGLRTILRQDPDKIMVGEIRDQETADIAIQAALTGHLVLSTLHTNDAPSAVTRLIDMGCEPFLISSTVIGTLAQRLCRKVCPECKEEYVPTKEELESINLVLDEGQTLVRSKGCDFCLNTGYLGRKAIYEMMIMTPGIRALITKNVPVEELRAFAVKEGMKTLQDNAAEKVINKISTIEEVQRVVYMN